MQEQVKNIPQTLKDLGEFCCWKYEVKNGRKTKVPYNPLTGYSARTNDSSTFVPHATAVNASGYEGIGIRVSGNLVGIDLDHCIEDREILSWAKEIIDRFNDTYIEVSPSGTGIRIFCLLPSNLNYDTETYYIKKNNIEVYIPGFTNRFLTITGNAITDADVVETAEALTWLLETYMHRPTPTTPTAITHGKSYLSDDSVITKASVATNGDKFKRLWNGDMSGYGTHSEADAALVSILAFWCSGDAEQIDRLFRTSALMREKWDAYRGADTYGNITIAKVISKMTDFYKPVIKLSAVEDFGVDRLKELDPTDQSKYPWNDIGAGHIFADFFQDRLRYVPERKMWFYYESGIWNKDIGSLRAMKYCMELANLMYTFALEITDEDKRKVYIKYSSKWQNHSTRVNILKDAQVHHPIHYGEFDADIYIFNCKNGTLHIDTGEFTEHRSTDLLTKISSVTYDPTARSERFTTYIDEIMSSDKDRAKFLQKILGYGLTGDTRHECMTILYGATTRNGKGTLCESVLKVLGEYGCTSRAETIAMKNYTNGSQPSEDVARLAGVRFVNISEPTKGMVLDAAKIKAMTGNDTLNARYLHENSFDFQPQFKIYVNTNYLPVINDMTLFTSDRIIIIPFDRHFDEQTRDTSLKQKFAEPEVQSAILNWLLEGYRLLRKEGLKLPKSVKDATERYQHDSDKMVLFFEDNLVADDTAEELTSTVYARYKGWCQENGCYAEGMKNFKQGLETFASVVRKRPKGGGEKTTLLVGYRLISEFDVPPLTA
ncbi:MAG: nucleoside triphosphatase [Ruminococcaceae bacterium]|nr:nucleoside triphosphatase [Oscillospiraceae bacterium]